jgi:peptidoglycan/LPS O-acetylase OafA/YrhL
VSEATRKANRRVDQLDGLRGIAVCAVMAFHLSLGVLAYGGFFSVDVFFVLSGFLITGVLLGEQMNRGRVSLKRFYVRRVLRLYPALVVMLVITSFWGATLAYHHSWGNWWLGVGAALTYQSTWVMMISGNEIFGHVGQIWTLAIEEWFYLIWAPLLAFLLVRVSDMRRLIVPVAVVSVALISILWVAWTPEHPNGITLYYSPFPRYGELLLGSVLAIMLARLRGPLPRVWDRLLGVASLLAVVGFWWLRRKYWNIFGQDPSLNVVGGVPFAAFFSLVIVARLATSDGAILSRFLRIPPLPYIGRLSYALYLWHMPLFLLIHGTVLKVVVTFAVSIASYHLVEMRFLKLKDRLRSTPIAGLGATSAQGGQAPVPGEAAPAERSAPASAPTAQA